jgi:hypothetical protein
MKEWDVAAPWACQPGAKRDGMGWTRRAGWCPADPEERDVS